MLNTSRLTICFSPQNFEVVWVSPQALKFFAIRPGEDLRKYCQENFNSIISTLGDAYLDNYIWQGDLSFKNIATNEWMKHHCALSVVVSTQGVAYILSCKDNITSDREFSQLVQQSKLASIGKLTGDLAHELSNPLSIIIGRTDEALRKLKDHTSTPHQLECDLERILTTSHRILKTIRSMRSFFRFSASDPKSKIFVSQIITESTDLIAERLKHWSIELEIQQQPNLIVQAKMGDIQQALLNLLLNSCDAIKGKANGKITLQIFADEKWVHFKVIDNGLGIQPSEQDLVMTPFYSTKDPELSSGLGLTITKNIAKAHGGSLALESSSDGTTVLLKIPSLANVY